METEKRDAKQVADLEDEREKLEKLVVKPLFARCVMSNTKPDFSSVEEQYLQRKCLPFKTHASLWQNETKLPKAFIAEMNKWNRAANGTASGDGKLVKWSKKELEMLTEFDPKLYAPDGSTPAPTAEKFEEDPTFTAQQVRDYGKALLEVEKSCLDYYYAEGKQVGGVVEVRNAYDLSKLPRRCFEGAKAVAPKTGGEEVVDSEIDDGDRAYRFEFYKYREDTSKLSALDRLKLHCRSHCLFGVEKCKEVFQKSAFQLAKDTVTDTANAVGDLGTALKNGGRTDTALSAGASPAMRRAQRWVCDKYAKIVAARKSTPAWTPEGRAMAELSDDEIWKQAEKEGEELFSGVDFAPPKPEEENPDGPDAGAEGAPATTPASGAGVGADNQPEPPEDKIAKRVEIPVPADPAVSLTDDILRSAYESAYFHAYGHKPTSGAETAASAVANGVKQLFGSMMELSKTGLNAGKQNACKMLGKLAGTSDAPIIEQPSPNELARKLLEKIMADKKEREISLKLFGAAGQWETKKAIYGLMHQYKSPGEDNCAPNYTVSVDDPAYARWKQVNEAKIALEKEALDGAAHPEKTRTGHGRENGVSAAAAKQMEKLGALTSKGGIAEAEERFNSEGTLRTLKISIRPLKKDGVLNFQKCKYPTDLKKKLAEALGVEAERVVMPREGNKVNKRGDRLTVQYAVKEKPISKEPPKPAPGPDPCAGLLEAMCKAPPPISPPHVDAIFRSERPAEMLARELVDDGADSCFHHVRAHVQKRGYETRAWVELRVPKVEIFQDVNGGVVKTGDKVQIFDEEDFSARFPFSVGKFAGATNAQPFAPENGVDAKMYAGGGDEKFLRVWPAKQGVIDLSQPPVLVPARLVVKHETGGFRSGDLARVRPEFEEDAVEGERKAPGTGADDATGGADVEMAAAGGATTGANGATSGLQIGTKRLRTKFQDVGTAAGGAAGQDDETGPPPVPPISSKQQLHNALDNAYVQVVRPPDYSVPNPTATVRLVRPVRVKNLPDFDIERMVTEARDEYFGLHTKVKNTTNKLAPQHCMDGWRPFSPEFAGLRKEPQNVVAGSGTGRSEIPSADYSVENGALGENATLHLRCGADFPRPRDAFCKGGRCNEMDNYTCCGPPTNNQSCLSATECDPCIHVQHQDEPDQVESRGFCVATGSEALKMIWPTKQEAALLKQSQQQALEDKRDTSVPDAYHTEDRTFWKNNEAWLQGLQITFREPGAPAQDGAVNTVSASEDLLAAEEARASGHPQVDPDGMDAAESAAPADTSDAATSSSSALAVSQKRLLHPSAFQDAGTTTSSAAGDAGGAAPAADEEPPPVKKFYGPFAGKHAWLGRYFPHTDEYELFFDEPLEIPAEQLQRSRLRKGVKMHVKLPEGTEYDATLKGFSHGTHPTSVSLLGTSAAPAQLDLTLFDYTSKKIPLQYAHESEAYTCPAVGAEAEPEGGGGGQANDGAATGNAQTAGAAGADADTDETRRDAAVERALAAATKNLPCVKVVPFTEGEKKQKLERARKTIMRRELIKYAKCDFGAAPVRKMIAARLQGKLAKPNDNRFNPDANDRTLDVFFHGYADAYWRRIRDEMKLSNPFSADSFFKSIPTVTRKELQQRGYPSIVADFEGKGVISGDKACRIKTFKTMDKNNAEAAEELGAVSEEEEERAAAAETAAAEEKHAAEDPEIAAEKNKTLLERLADGIRVKEDEDGKPLKDAHGEELKPLTGEALVSDPGHLYREAARRMVFENFLRMGRPLPPATHELAVRAEQPHPQPHPHEQAPAAPPAAPEGEDAPSEGAEGAAANGETSDEEKKLQQEEEGLTDAFSNLLNAVASKMHAGTVSLGSKLGSTAVGQMVLKNGLEARDVLASILPKAEKDCPPIPATPLALFAKDEYAHRGQVVNYGNGPAGEVSLGYLYFRRRHADFAENIVERLKRVTVKHLDKNIMVGPGGKWASAGPVINIKHELLMENPKKVAKVRDEAEKCRRKNGGMKKLEEDEENYQQDDTSDDGGEGNGGGAEMQGADGGMDMHVDAAKKIAADADVEFAIAPSNPVESGPSLADNADENNLAVHQNEAAKAAEGEEGDEGADEGGPSGPAEAGDSAAREDREPMDRYLKLLFLRARNEDFRAAVHEVAGDVASKCRGETSRPLLLQRAFEAMNGIPEEKAMLCRPKVGKCEAITEPKQCVEAKLCRLQFAKCVVQDLKNATAADERECGGRTTEEECASASGGAEDVADEPEAADEDPVGSETEPPKAANKPNASPLCQWKEFQCRTQTLNARKLAREPWNRNAQMYFGCQTLAHEECEASQDYCEWNSGLVCRKKLPLAEGEEDGATEDTEKADTATAAVTAASPANESAPEPCRLAILGSQENVEKACGAHVGENVCTVEPAPGVEHRYIERFLPPLENAPLMLNEGPKNEHTEHRNEDNWPMLRELAVVPEKTLIQVKGVQKSLEKFFKIVLDEALESDQEKVNAGTKALDAAQQEETGAPASKSAGKSTMSKLREAAVASGSLAGMNVLERNELENLAQDRAVALLQYFEPDIERDMIRGITNRLGPARTPDFAWALERDMRFFNEMRDSATEAAFMDRLLRAFQVFRNLPSSGVAGIQDAMAVAKEDVTWFVTKKMAPKVKGAPSHFSMDDIVTKMQKLIQKAMSSMACVILDPIEAKIQVHGTAVMDTLLPLLTSFWGNMAAIALMFTVQRMGSNSDYETQSNWFGTDLTDVVGDTRENPDYDNDMSSKKFFPGVWNAVQTDVCQTLSADQCEHVEPCVKVPIPAPKGKKGKETTSRLEDDESTKHYTCMNREEAASAIVSETGEKASLPVGDRFFGVTKTNGRMPDWAFDWDFEKPVNPTLILPEVIKNAKLRDRIVAEGEAAKPGSRSPQRGKMVFEKTLVTMVKGIRGARGQEEQYIQQSIQEIKLELQSSNLHVKSMAVLKLAYLNMIGYDIMWASFQIVDCMSRCEKMSLRRPAYLAAAFCFQEKNDLGLMLINHFKKNLMSGNKTPTELGIALSNLAVICTPDMGRELINDLIALLSSNKPYIRKKVVLCMFRLFLRVGVKEDEEKFVSFCDALQEAISELVLSPHVEVSERATMAFYLLEWCAKRKASLQDFYPTNELDPLGLDDEDTVPQPEGMELDVPFFEDEPAHTVEDPAEDATYADLPNYQQDLVLLQQQQQAQQMQNGTPQAANGENALFLLKQGVQAGVVQGADQAPPSPPKPVDPLAAMREKLQQNKQQFAVKRKEKP
eukprot:g19189.t1